MAHQRKLIRAAVISKLKTGGTVAGNRVFGNRARQIFAKEMPCILVYTKNEPAEISNEAPREYMRTVHVSVELVATADDEDLLDDVLDDFAEQVENLMFQDETFGGLATDTLLGETEMDILTEGEKPIGAVKITFSIPYFQYIPAEPSGPLDDLNRIGVTIDPAPGDAVNHALSSDLIDLT